MDVTCSHCQSVYEFDDTLVSPKGVVVRCTHCGHLFKIFPPGASPSAPEESGWMLRREDGTVFAIDRFSTLQKWIGQGKVTRRDELSRTGESWKRIGDIVELSPFFDLVETAGTSQRTDTSPSIPAVRPREGLVAGSGGDAKSAFETTQDQKSFKPEARPRPPEVPADDVPVGTGETVRATSFDLAAARRISTGAPPEEASAAPTFEVAPAESPPAQPRAASRPPRRPVVPPGDMRFSSDELPPPRRRGTWIAVVLVLLAAAAIAGIIFRQQLTRFVQKIFGGEEGAATASEQHLENADRLFGRETAASLREAEAEYAKVLNFNQSDERALGGMLELHATLAQFLRDEVDVGGVLGLPARDPAEAQRLQGAFDLEMAKARELALALEHSGRAVDELPVEALRALADAARLRGDRATARKLAGLAVARAPNDARSRYIDAMVAMDDALAGPDLRGAAPGVEAAFARTLALDVLGSGLARARLHLAQYLALAGRTGEARGLVKCVVDGGQACPGGRGEPHPDHAIAQKIAAWLPLLPADFKGPVALAVPAAVPGPVELLAADAGAPMPEEDAALEASAVDADADAPALQDGAADADAVDAGLDAEAAEAGADAEAGEIGAEASRAEAMEMPSSLDELLAAAQSALENGSTQRAITLLQRAAQIDPTDSEVQVNLGYAYLDAGRNADARRSFERALQVSGSNPDALLGMGDILLGQGSMESALDYYRRALAGARTPYQRRIAERKVQDLEDRLQARGMLPAADAGTRPPTPTPTPAPTPTPTPTPPRPPADVPVSDMPAVDSEPPGLPPVTDP